MGVGECIAVVVFTLCVFITLWVYMCICGETGTKLFEDPRYADRIKALEKKVEELMKK